MNFYNLLSLIAVLCIIAFGATLIAAIYFNKKHSKYLTTLAGSAIAIFILCGIATTVAVFAELIEMWVS